MMMMMVMMMMILFMQILQTVKYENVQVMEREFVFLISCHSRLDSSSERVNLIALQQSIIFQLNYHRSLRSKGVYNRVRLVLDLKEYYYLAGEYMDSNECKGTFISRDNRILQQLSDGVRTRYPAILTHKFACDISIATLMRARTLGNSTSAMQNNIRELHSEAWCRRLLWYLADCDRHRLGRERLHMSACEYEEAPGFSSFPNVKWFLACYVKDVWTRLPLLKASMTSVYGNVLKIDSTKKVRRTLEITPRNVTKLLQQ